MMKNKNKILSAVAFLLYGTTSFAQVTTPTNVSPFGTPFVGWNNAGIVRDLEIRNEDWCVFLLVLTPFFFSLVLSFLPYS